MQIICRVFFIVLVGLFSFADILHAQFNSPLGRDISLSVEHDMNTSGEVFFSSWHPYLQEHVTQASSTALTWNAPQKTNQSWWSRKFFNENLFIRQDSGYMIFLDPVFDFSYGKESTTNRNLFVNSRGVRAGGRLGEHFAFETEIYENQSILPSHVDNFVNQWRVVPGQGSARRYKKTGRDYSNVSGYISWSPSQSQNLQFGHGKHFVGDGYRSLLLSDNSFAYPYIKYTCTLGRWQYVRTVASLMNITSRSSDSEEFPKKTAGFDYLTVDIGRRIQISLFEGNIWANPDSTKRFKPSFGVFNPIILTNTLFTSGREDMHSLLGLNVKCLVNKNIVLYGQVMFDDIMNTTKNAGIQMGAKYFDVMGLPGLFLQAEINQMENGAYSYVRNTGISYVHYNQTIAHPLGNNFKEMVAIASYSFRKFRFEYRLNIAEERESGIIPPKEFAVYTGEKKVVFNHIQAAWIMNQRNTMQLIAGYTDRNESSSVNPLHTGSFFIAFRTVLRNHYYDF